MKYTDPSGYFLKKLGNELSRAWQRIRPFVSTIVAVALTASGIFTGIGAPMLIGAIAGAAGAAANGGNLRDVIKAGVIGGITADLFAGVGALSEGWTTAGKVLAHGITGGAVSVMQGGKFGHGFMSAGVAKFASNQLNARGVFNKVSDAVGNKTAALIARTSISAVVGGVTAKLGGGKFANGATTAAFAHLFNAVASERRAAAQKGDGFFKGLWKKATGWHFEGRDARNAKFESLSIDQVENAEGWTEMTGVQASAHQDKIPGVERKFIHTSGGELVFSGKDNSLITDPAYKGTFNYINGVAWEDVNGVGSFAAFVFKGAGHMVVDYAPWTMGGNIRGAE